MTQVTTPQVRKSLSGPTGMGLYLVFFSLQGIRKVVAQPDEDPGESWVVLQYFFQELGSICDAVRAVTEGLTGPDALQELAPGGAVPLLELRHDLLHPGAGEGTVLAQQADDHAGTDKGATGAFHIAHPDTKGSGDIQCCLLRKAYKVTIGAYDRLGAVM